MLCSSLRCSTIGPDRCILSSPASLVDNEGEECSVQKALAPEIWTKRETGNGGNVVGRRARRGLGDSRDGPSRLGTLVVGRRGLGWDGESVEAWTLVVGRGARRGPGISWWSWRPVERPGWWDGEPLGPALGTPWCERALIKARHLMVRRRARSRPVRILVVPKCPPSRPRILVVRSWVMTAGGFFSPFSMMCSSLRCSTIGQTDVSCPHQLHSSTTKVRSVWYKRCCPEI
jgi:hypothetical protein